MMRVSAVYCRWVDGVCTSQERLEEVRKKREIREDLIPLLL